MGGGGGSEAARCGTCVVETPVEPRAHPADQHAATWVAGEAHPASFHSSYMNATPSSAASGFVDTNQSGGGGGGENPYVHVAPLNASAPSGRSPMDKMLGALNRCGKRFEDASRKAEAQRRSRTMSGITLELALASQMQQWLDLLRGQKCSLKGDRIRYFNIHLRFCQERSS